jgi:benzoyl-CoA reductase/2-hydroxyglutaryl-CoA dehydratase subunit BcrC/BadD/HgdB
MIQNCYEYAVAAKAEGRKIVGIMCEYTPREIIMAAGALPVCLCGGSHEMTVPAERDLPAGLCPLIKSTYGYCVTKKNPFLEMADLIVAETTCDGKKKMFELMARRKPMYVLELPQKPDDADAGKHWLEELRKLRAHLEAAFGKNISDDDLRAASEQMNRERHLRRQLARTMQSDTPPWSGRQLLSYQSSIAAIPCDLAEYERLLSQAKTISGTKTKCRILLTGVPVVRGAEKVIDLIERAGAAVVCMESCSGVKPVLQDVRLNGTDPLEAIAEKYFHLPCSVMTTNTARLDSLRALARDYRADCIVDLVWQGCLTYDVESWFVRELSDELELPYLKIVTDYNPSDAQRLALRIEALIETAGQRK